MIVGLELLAQAGKPLADLRALVEWRPRPDLNDRVAKRRHVRDRHLAPRRGRLLLDELVARDRVRPRPQRRLPAKLRQSSPDPLARGAEHVVRERAIACEPHEKAVDLAPVVLDRQPHRAVHVVAVKMPANLELGVGHSHAAYLYLGPPVSASASARHGASHRMVSLASTARCANWTASLAPSFR